MEHVAALVSALRAKGVRIWSDGTHLFYKYSNAQPTPRELEILRAEKPAILQYLSSTAQSDPETPALSSARPNRAPLSYALQLAWSIMELNGFDRWRGVISAFEIRGPLDTTILRTSVQLLVQRHEALRTRIVAIEGTPWQQIEAEPRFEFEVTDLTSTAVQDFDQEIQSSIARLSGRPCAQTSSAPFRVNVLKSSSDLHAMVCAMNQTIIDAASGAILRRDLWELYRHCASGASPSLPQIRMQPSDFALRQRELRDSPLKQRHDAHWHQHLAGAHRLAVLPEENRRARADAPAWGMQPLQLGSRVAGELRKLCRLQGTTFAMAALSIYTALICRWCMTYDVVVPFFSGARVWPDIENTVGLFASVLLLRMDLSPENTFLEVLRAVTMEHLAALANHDLGEIYIRTPRLECTRNPIFFWHPSGFRENSHNHIEIVSRDHALKHSLETRGLPLNDGIAQDFKVDPDDAPFDLDLYETPEGAVGKITYQANCVCADTVDRFARNYVHFSEVLAERPHVRLKEITCIT
ncbi:MAG TPA: condensation domain-containing protein [Steroidobacteraceae bacterium]